MQNFDRDRLNDFSIIVPCKWVDKYTKRCISFCERIYPEVELIVITDEDCPGYPAAKRNWAMARAKGKYFAFLDSDAYPAKDWLETAHHLLTSYDAVCGPGILPPDSPKLERVADVVFQMLPYSYRVVPQEHGFVAEYPTFNLIVKREVATEFENYLTGEDSLFCRKIKQGIFYHPNVLVYHSRRPAFKGLWKQVGTYGRHRGNFIRLAIFAFVSSCFVYSINFIKGFFMRRPS